MTLWLSLAAAGAPLALALRFFGAADPRRARRLGRAGAAVLMLLLTCAALGPWTAPAGECGGLAGGLGNPWVAGVQAVIALLLIARFVWTARGVRARERDARLVPAAENPVAPRRVELHADAAMPAAWAGAGAARILFPARLWRELDARSRALILFHEDAHLRGGDVWWRWALDAALWLSLGNPAFFLLRRELIRLDEFVADDRALERARASRAELVRLFLRVTAAPSGMLPAAAAGFPGELRARSERLLRPERRPALRALRRALTLAGFAAWGLGAVTASAYEARLLRAEFSAAGFALHRTEIRFGILNPLLESDVLTEPQTQCRRNP